jgi:pimeloyl-ACP methyl ester carboxylesterase
MGGKVAMWLALNYAGRVRQLLIVDIAPVNYRHGFDNILQALQGLPLEKISNRKQALELLSSVIPEQSFSQFLLQNLQLVDGQYRWRIDLDIFANTVSAIPAFPSIEQMQAFAGPTLFVAGGDSQHIKPEYTETIQAMFPTAEIKTLPDAGHWLHVQNPALFVEMVEEFLT